MIRQSYPQNTLDKGVYTEIRKFGCDVLLPNNYDKTKQYIWWVFIHGVGERSAGTQADLDNLFLGFDYNNDGVREPAFTIPDIKTAVDKYGIIVVIPTYKGFFEPAKMDLIYDFMLLNFSVTSRFVIDGFSLGGGATEKYFTSNLERAKRCIVAIPCAPTRSGMDWRYVRDANLPVHYFVNDNDDNGNTNMAVTVAGVNNINSFNPPVRANYTAFRADGHGGFNRANALNPPAAPGGKGVINVAENVYEWALDVYHNGPRSMKTGSIVTPPVEPPPTSFIKAIASYSGTGPAIRLVGDKSTGWETGYEGAWSLVSGPNWVTSKQVFPNGSSFINSTALLPYPGTYIFRLTLKGSTLPAEITVVYGTATEPPITEPKPTTAKAVGSYSGTGPTIRLIGDKSTGWQTGYEGVWSLLGGPDGVTTKQVFPNGSSFINATANLPVKGTYVFRLILQGAPEPANVTVIY